MPLMFSWAHPAGHCCTALLLTYPARVQSASGIGHVALSLPLFHAWL